MDGLPNFSFTGTIVIENPIKNYLYIMILGVLLKYITAKRVRQALKQGLAIVGAFYILEISYSFDTIVHFKAANIETEKIIKFLIIYGLIMLLFYPVLDFLLRVVFLKIMKRRILKASRERKVNKRLESIRLLNEFRIIMADFVMDYPVSLGYMNLKEIPPAEKIVVSDQEKDEAINEIVSAINRWLCTQIHLIVTLIVVFNFSPILMYILLAIILVLTPILVFGIIFCVEHIEALEHLMKELHKRKPYYIDAS